MCTIAERSCKTKLAYSRFRYLHSIVADKSLIKYGMNCSERVKLATQIQCGVVVMLWWSVYMSRNVWVCVCARALEYILLVSRLKKPNEGEPSTKPLIRADNNTQLTLPIVRMAYTQSEQHNRFYFGRSESRTRTKVHSGIKEACWVGAD
jgi:hypothetical protein